MNDNIKRDNRRALPGFLLMILCSALCGGVLGFLSEHFSMPVLELLTAARRGLTGWAYLLQLGWVALVGLVSFALYSRAKRVCKQAGPDSDEALEQADLLLGRSLLAVSVGLIGSFAWFTASIMGEWVSPRNLLLTLAGFVLAVAVFTLIQKLCVDQLRRMNPEKRGSVLDLRFKKDWLDSCDEAERHVIYKSAYKAYVAVTYTCIFSWAVLLVAYVGTERDLLLPALLVLLIWLVQTVVYCRESIRLEHGVKKTSNF